MRISQAEFKAVYGNGTPAMAGWAKSYGDPHVNPDADCRVLSALINTKRCKRCMEIGVHTGATARALLDGCKSIECYMGVDLEVMLQKGKPRNDGECGQYAVDDDRFFLMQLKNGSRDIVLDGIGEFRVKIGTFDFIFIDANKNIDAIKSDTELARKIINPGGVIAWHDYGHPELPYVKEYIDGIAPGYAAAAMNAVTVCSTPVFSVEKTAVCYQIIAANYAAPVKDKSDAQNNVEGTRDNIAGMGQDKPSKSQRKRPATDNI